jgi:hypothetical protein
MDDDPANRRRLTTLGLWQSRIFHVVPVLALLTGVIGHHSQEGAAMVAGDRELSAK